MMDIQGFWQDGKISASPEAVLHADAVGRLTVRVGNEAVVSAEIKEVKIPDRLGNIQRQLRFPNGGTFVTANNEAVDQLQRNLGKSSGGHKLHAAENRWSLALVCLTLIVGLIAWCLIWGVPLAAQGVAKVIPDAVVEYTDQTSIDFFDDVWLDPSNLPEARQKQLLNYFQPYIHTLQSSSDMPEIDVQFRDGGPLGANAFALPGGTIIFTDDIVELAKSDAELLSVLFHEIGHVEHQHGMRSVLQGSIIVLSLAFVTGDMNGVAELLLGIPVLLVNSAYSRDFETEADDYAYQNMKQEGIPLHHFADILSRMDHQHHHGDEANKGEENKSTDQGPVSHDTSDESSDKDVMGYFSTHPLTKDRIKRFETEGDE
ncbi:M48 family metallopeptidase [Porticoccaceae bacterium LTM1]|nr:M48 family metallopeptidase [Porticoccaceae bacterium LTM1]